MPLLTSAEDAHDEARDLFDEGREARRAYEEWKEVHLEDCGNGVFRTRWENAKVDATVSEGIGYGMLLTVAPNFQSFMDAELPPSLPGVVC